MSVKHSLALRSLARLASVLTANQISQRCLFNAVRSADYLMGIGAGAGVDDSGEASVVRRLRELRRPEGLVIFDVGANRGQFLHMCQEQLSGCRHLVHCFEPSHATYTTLQESAEGLTDVTLNNFGLGREAGERLLFMPNPGSGLASLTKRRLDHFGIDVSESEEVRIDTLDNYCSIHSITSIDLLKIDVEGHEMDVLAGSAGMLRKKAIRYVTFEFGGCNIDTHTFFQDFYYFFRDNGMQLARITPGGFWFDIGRYNEQYEQFRTTNFVAQLTPVE